MKKRFDSLAIDVSDRCNMKCTYCFETRDKSIHFSPIDARALYRSIDYFIYHLVPDNIKTLHFHFGRREPLFGFPLLKEVVYYIEEKTLKHSFRPRYHLTTNGTYFKKEITQFLKEKNFDIRISVDGFSEVHDRNRRFANGKGSFERILANLNILKKQNIKFTINSVYYPRIPFYVLFKFFNSIGAERVDFFPLWIPDSEANGYFGDRNKTKVKEDIEKLIDEQIKEIDSQASYRTTASRIVQIENYLLCLFGFNYYHFYCGAGRSYLGVSGQGHFYPCLKFINSGQWMLGDYSKGIDRDILSKYSENAAPPVTELTPCRNCSIKYMCKGICYVDRINLKNYSRSMEFYCYFQRVLFDATNMLFYTFKETRPDVLIHLAGLDMNLSD